jgi:hypothetical protein
MSRALVNLVSVNTVPERAKLVIGKVIDGVKGRYTIVHAGNSESQAAHMYSDLPILRLSYRRREAPLIVGPAAPRHPGEPLRESSEWFLMTSFAHPWYESCFDVD